MHARPRRAFSPSDKSILVIHALVAVSIGVIGVLSASDGGWADLQRVVIVMLTVIWLALVAGSALIARFVDNAWARTVFLIGAPVFVLFAIVLAVR